MTPRQALRVLPDFPVVTIVADDGGDRMGLLIGVRKCPCCRNLLGILLTDDPAAPVTPEELESPQGLPDDKLIEIEAPLQRFRFV